MLRNTSIKKKTETQFTREKEGSKREDRRESERAIQERESEGEIEREGGQESERVIHRERRETKGYEPFEREIEITRGNIPRRGAGVGIK